MIVESTALAFALEVMEWTDCKPAKASWRDSIMGYAMDDTFPGRRIKTRFQYNNLDEVLDEVRKWCKEKRLWWKVGDSEHPVKNGVYCDIGARYDSGWLLAEAHSDNPCEALMQACLQAARKLKENTP